MEQPYKGRAVIIDNVIDLQIIIPAKKNWLLIIFLGGWLGGWFLGETFAIVAVIGILRGNPASLFILFWLIAWTAGGLFALRAFLWLLRGKEVITVEQGTLNICKKGALFFNPKTYDLKEVKNIRIQENVYGDGGWQRNNSGVLGSGGTIKFEYGLRSVRFANDIDEAEAKFIIDKLKEKHFLTEQNFASNN